MHLMYELKENRLNYILYSLIITLSNFDQIIAMDSTHAVAIQDIISTLCHTWLLL